MLASKMRWDVRTPDKEKVEQLAGRLGITPLAASLLVMRGYDTADKASSFLYGKDAVFHDPYLLKDMEKAVRRIKQAISDQEKIMIYGDYDADGVTSTTVLLQMLKKCSAQADFYIPDRFKEGYGPNEAAFRGIKESGYSLIITVDTGIAGVHEAEVAKELGIDLIITDHHEPGPVLPDAYAIIHPKQPGCGYPFKELAGVGVAFKLAHALNGELPEDLLDLCAIGTIADLVPLHNENREIAKRGMEQFRKTKRPGLKALAKIAGAEIHSADEETIGFQIAPRLNAVGRIEQADPAVYLLNTEDETEAEELAEDINALNKERQKIVNQMTEEAVQMIEEEGLDQPVIVAARPGWNPGVVGIVASKLVERFYRPAIVLGIDEEKGIAKGSARSIKGFDLFQNLSECRDILPHFGGHPMAAGMTLNLEDVSALRERINRQAEAVLTEEDFIPVQDVDLCCRLEDITIDSIAEMNMLAPFGTGNPKPFVLVSDVKIDDARKIGANKNHLKLVLADGENKLDCIGFYKGAIEEGIVPGAKISIVGELSINEWNNRKKPQLMIKDAAVNEWQLFDLRGKRSWEEKILQLDPAKRACICFREETKAKLAGTGLEEELTVISGPEDAERLDLESRYAVFIDIPQSLDIFDHVINGKKLERIYLIFYQSDEHFFSTFPTREYFKWYYAFLLKRGSFDLPKYGGELARHKGWTKDTIDFMTKVFFELGFVTIENGVLSVVYHAEKRDLTDSETYREKQRLIELEQKLIYSSADELKQWLDKRMAENAGAYKV
ncbi:single-stranded-DNA-specific exonuclease RecJ [Bacillus haynesii]|uniref:single-stranded-DNA-specific exonuclease RecJ n=1 Tax=Bacillus haynesii TaxID=1925021 RepID=UPI00227E58FD|nr:single-stranded-DNA-specific exonuclease RecJ [Bacillus haynesii]MCY7860322.1 single-stranded-DNA-specific exonuclease RecJ [Bacillus haynesii]MCY8754931.1 single-stranded-DNA-specific exonuclease RecJ [Bacillus haynesii]